MIIEKHNSEVLLESENKTVNATIAKESVGFVANILSRNFYSKPIESICREIASNCLDAHIDAGIPDRKFDIIINSDKIIFRDYGNSMTQLKMKNLFMNLLTSTKRNSDDFIGGWGIGSKSPFAYRDNFYIHTRIKGVEKKYLIHFYGDLPGLDFISESSTELENGTDVVIFFKNFSDKFNFIAGCKEQLCYFKTVNFINEISENTIVEANEFIYSTNCTYKNIHAIVGCAPYPLDFSVLNLPGYSIPIGIKFGVGELKVTPNREALKYTPEVIEIIKRKYYKTIKKLKTLLVKKECNNIVEYLHFKNKKPQLNIGGYNMEWAGCNIKVVSYRGLNNNVCFNQLRSGELKEMLKSIMHKEHLDSSIQFENLIRYSNKSEYTSRYNHNKTNGVYVNPRFKWKNYYPLRSDVKYARVMYLIFKDLMKIPSNKNSTKSSNTSGDGYKKVNKTLKLSTGHIKVKIADLNNSHYFLPEDNNLDINFINRLYSINFNNNLSLFYPKNDNDVQILEKNNVKKITLREIFEQSFESVVEANFYSDLDELKNKFDINLSNFNKYHELIIKLKQNIHFKTSDYHLKKLDTYLGFKYKQLSKYYNKKQLEQLEGYEYIISLFKSANINIQDVDDVIYYKDKVYSLIHSNTKITNLFFTKDQIRKYEERRLMKLKEEGNRLIEEQKIKIKENTLLDKFLELLEK